MKWYIVLVLSGDCGVDGSGCDSDIVALMLVIYVLVMAMVMV